VYSILAFPHRIESDSQMPFGFNLKEKANAIAEIPDQIRTMTLVVVGVGILSIIALFMSAMAVRNAN
jgi:hypothetical protein